MCKFYGTSNAIVGIDDLLGKKKEKGAQKSQDEIPKEVYLTGDVHPMAKRMLIMSFMANPL